MFLCLPLFTKFDQLKLGSVGSLQGSPESVWRKESGEQIPEKRVSRNRVWRKELGVKRVQKKFVSMSNPGPWMTDWSQYLIYCNWRTGSARRCEPANIQYL